MSVSISRTYLNKAFRRGALSIAIDRLVQIEGVKKAQVSIQYNYPDGVSETKTLTDGDIEMLDKIDKPIRYLWIRGWPIELGLPIYTLTCFIFNNELHISASAETHASALVVIDHLDASLELKEIQNNSEEESTCPSSTKSLKIRFYEHPFFLSISAVFILAAAIVTVLKYINI